MPVSGHGPWRGVATTLGAPALLFVAGAFLLTFLTIGPLKLGPTGPRRPRRQAAVPATR